MKDNFNFVERTQRNLKYLSNQIKLNKIHINNDKFYEVTNMLNCCLGLVSYVYEYTYDEVLKKTNATSRDKIDVLVMNKLSTMLNSLHFEENKYGVIKKSMEYGNNNNTMCKDMPTIIRHMRNAICHGHIKPKGQPYIKKIEFTNKYKNKIRFQAVMTIDNLEQFINDVSDEYLKNTNKKQ